MFLIAPAAIAKCGEVEITEMNWTSSQVVTAVASSIMEKGYGCTVKRVASTTVKAMASVTETGKPDIVTELWINSAPTYAALVEAGKVETLANVLSEGGVEGWWIPKYLADKHPELRSIDGILKMPDLVAGQFHNCPTGWGCRVINDNLAAAFALKKSGIEIVNHKSGKTLADSISSAFVSKKPWFGYYWAPTAILGKYPMVKVDVGPHVASAHACNKRSDCETPGKSAYPTGRVITFATKAFIAREPAVAELMKRLSFSNNQMGKLLAWKAAKKATADEAAQHFLATYREVWSDWVGEEARKKLLALSN